MIHPPAIFAKIRPLQNLSSSLLKRYARLFKGRYSVERRMGVRMLLDQTNVVDRHLLLRGAWEAEQIAFLAGLVRRHRKPGERCVFLDIGAHGALYALTLERELQFDEIVAFEPSPVNLAQLRANLLLNDCVGRVRVVEQAVSDREGRATFVVSNARNRGHSRIHGGDLASGEAMIEVATTTIDSLPGPRGALVVAKIDVEGGELAVLKGMGATLATNRVILQVERNTGALSDLVETLAPAGLTFLKSIDHDHYFVKA